MTNQSPSWMRNLARKAASSSTSSSASTAASSMPAVSTSAVSTSATTSSAAATCPTASSVSTGTSACSTTSTPCPRSAGWSAETSEVHCSDTLITHFLILERWCYLVWCYLVWCYLPKEKAISLLTSWSSPHTYIMTVVTKKITTPV